MNNLNEQIINDCVYWLENFVEKPHKFYNFEFSPCPYAKKIRIGKQLLIKAFDEGSFLDFVNSSIDMYFESSKIVLAMLAPSTFDTVINRFRLKRLNKVLVPKNSYLQVGNTKGMKSRYPNDDDFYMVILVNKLDMVLEGSNYLKEHTNYYENWTKKHLQTVVSDRENLWKKYS